MKKNFILGVVGAGFMSSSIVKSVLDSEILKPSQIIVSDKSDDALAKTEKTGVNVTKDNLYLANASDFVLFAVKPQNFVEVAESIKGTSCNKFISIMAGVKISKIKNLLGKVKVARFMPNTPCSLGCGAVGADTSDFEGEDLKFINKILSVLGAFVSLKEEQLGTVTGISGSSPAYFYLFLKSIIESGVKNGLSYEDAKILAVNTMIGSGKMVLNNQDKSLDDLITAVCSKGGTTIEAVNVFNQNGLAETVDKAIEACIKRSKELENL